MFQEQKNRTVNVLINLYSAYFTFLIFIYNYMYCD